MAVETETSIDAEELEAQEGEVNLDTLQTDFAFRGPVALRLVVEEKAADAKLSVTQYLRKIVADSVGYALQANPGRATQSEDEKKAKLEEAKQKAKDERAKVRATIDALRKQAEAEAAPATA
jgi:hypothetical protein